MGGFGFNPAGGGGGIPPGPSGSSMKLLYVTEEISIAAAAFTDSVANLLKGGRNIFCVSYRVTAAIPTAATFDIGDNSGVNDNAFGDNILTALGTNDNMWTNVFQNNFVQNGDAKIRIRPNATPGAATGKVRVVVFYWECTNPTS